MGGALLLFILAFGLWTGIQIHDKKLSWRAAIAPAMFGLFVGGTSAGPVFRQSVVDFCAWALFGLASLAGA